MAKTTITQITDDIDGSKDASEVTFSYQGTEYAIDLGRKNKSGLEKALQPYIDAASQVSRRTRPRAKSSKRAGTELGAVRAWAKDNGYKVSDRGRMPAAVLDAYNATH